MVKVIKENFSKYKRIYAISDLHGFLDLFNQFYDDLNLKKDEALVIVGDIIEKGEQSLGLVRRLMELCEVQDNLYILRGNNDTLLKEFVNDEYSDEEVLGYLTRYKDMQSILIDIAKENHIDYTSLEGIKSLKKIITSNYQKEMNFLDSFPHILDCERAIFVHAGIKPNIELEKQEEGFVLEAKAFASMGYHFEKPVVVGHWPSSNYSDSKIIVNSYYDRKSNIGFVLEAKAFASMGYHFEKPVVVGHWPSSNYSDSKIIVNSYYDRKSNIVSIDGGVGIKGWYQINVLIFDENGIAFDAYDDLPEEIALEDQKEKQDAVTLIFPKTEVQILERGERISKCYVPYLQKIMEFDNTSLYQYKGAEYCEDFTNVELSVFSGETISKCIGLNMEKLYKKNGIVGYYKGKTDYREVLG